MKIKRIEINKLNPAEYNPRLDLQKGDKDYDAMQRSIEKFGCVEPIVWNEATGNVVGGHQRLKVLIANGETEADVSIVNLSLEDEKSLNIALNKISGDWDNDKLAELLNELRLAEVDISLTGFDDSEINKLLAGFESNEIIEDDFDVDAAIPEDPITKRGDVWLLGKHKLICADSTLINIYHLLLGNEKVNLVLTDPPYNVNYEGEAGKILNDNLTDGNFYDLLYNSFTNAYEVMENGASIYIFYSELESVNFINAFKDAGFHHHCTCIWAKQSFVMGRCDYQWQHEPVIYGWKEGAPHNWYSDHSQSSVWEFDRPVKSDLHPTMKPVELCAYPIRNSSKKYDIVLDMFGGSGSTLLACHQTDRICRTIEIDERFCDVIVKRYEEFTGEKAKLIRNGEEI